MLKLIDRFLAWVTPKCPDCGSEMIVMGADGSPIRFCAPCSNYKNSKERDDG